MPKVLFCGLKYEYGKPEFGLSSIEYNTFYSALRHMPGVEAEFFGVDEQMAQVGRDVMNRRLIQKVQSYKPDLLFCVLFTDEIKKDTIGFITKQTATKTFNWFTDDHWRFPVFSGFWAPLFTLVGTTDSKALEKYRRLGINNVIKTQWAANVSQELRVNKNGFGSDSKYKITFVGQNYGKRLSYISSLQKAGLPAIGYGKGWSGGTISEEKKLEIFSQSKINLNFTESYFSWPRQLAKLFIKKEFGHYRANLQSPISNLQSFLGARRRQIKARVFEIPAQGGFLMTGEADNLGQYYIDGKEIVVFKDTKDLVEKCRYYLSHNEERQAIAKAGYDRTIKQHTYQARFKEIFGALGLIRPD